MQSGQTAAALATCPDTACTVWGSTYELHPSWGTAFHDRFLNGTEFRTNLLYAHLAFNSIVFVLMHIQLWRPGAGANATLHAYLGRVSFACLTIGTVCAIWLAASHGSVDEYGGNLSMYGFWSMSFFVYGCAVMGPILRDYPSANILLCIWVSAPLGILIAEVVRRKILDKQSNGTKQRGDLAYD